MNIEIISIPNKSYLLNTNIKPNIKYCRQLIFLIFFFILLIFNNKNNIKQNLTESSLRDYIKKNQKQISSQKNIKKEIYLITQYIQSLKNGSIKIDNYRRILMPKISFIATVYNKEKYLNSFILSIQNQLLQEFEIILVDDCSTDKSVNIIYDFMTKDKRIKIIKNKNNMGSLYSRYIGAIHTKGKYIIFVDSDDIILKEGLIKVYNYMKNNNLDIVQFHPAFNINGRTFINLRYYKYSNIIYQPLLSYVFYYKNNEGYEGNTALWDKLIKKKVVLKAFKEIGETYLKQKIIRENDVILLFMFFRNSNSYKYIDEIGYYYYSSNRDSITNRQYNKDKNQLIFSIFTNIEFLYQKTRNTYLDKYFCVYKLYQSYYRYWNILKSKDYQIVLISNVINKLLNSKVISDKNKKMIVKIKSVILKNV